MNRPAAVASLKAAAAAAETLAQDLEQRKLWEGDFQTRLHEIQQHLARAEREGPWPNQS